MIRGWIATALLAGSWLFGLGYYQPANIVIWGTLLLAAVILLGDLPVPQLAGRHSKLAALLLLPAVWLVPLPYRAIPLLLAIGLVLIQSPVPRRWPQWLARGVIASAAILLAQSLALEGYAMLTARAHELPSLLARALAVVTRTLGVETAVDGSWLVLRSLEQTHRVGATWDLLLDAGSVCFLVGGWVLLGLWRSGRDGETVNRFQAGLFDLVRLAAIGVVWAPLRAAMLIGLWLQRLLRADSLGEVNVADVFVNAWLHLLLLAGLAWLARRLIGRGAARLQEGQHVVASGRDGESDRGETGPRRAAAPWLIAAGIGLAAFVWHWDPVGQPQAGRIMIVERHSTWEPTTTPYGTEVYGEAGSYNYAAAYDYCGQYFQMSRLLETDAIDDRTLARCDVLVIKTPTSRYAEDEIAAVVRFVERGGALLMIGDHTNVFNMNTSLNDVSRHFGFTFRNDLLFRVGTPYEQEYRPPVVASPIVQHVPPMNFAVSCSIDPGRSSGRMVIRSAGLFNLPPAYHEMNYHPQAEYRPHMHFGAWCQLWATRYGQGRVLAFADSTLFSNFCVFQPGKAELLRGMLAWLNHRSVFDRRTVRLAMVLPLGVLAALLLAAGLWLGRRQNLGWTLLVAAGYAGWTVAAVAVIADHRRALPVPPVRQALPHVVLDRTVSQVPLFTGAFADDKSGLGYGLFEQWIPRIGNWTSRGTGPQVLEGDAIVIVCPTRSVAPEYQQRLREFVAAGGNLLVLDSPDVTGSTANSILWPFGLASTAAGAEQNAGPLIWADSLQIPTTPLLASCRIDGGQAIAAIGETPVAAQVRYGRGLVTAVGFGSLFNDAAMGTHWLPEPEPDTLLRYRVLYGLLRAALPYRLQAAQITQSLPDGFDA
jgi:hypothetical protein